MKVSVMYFVSQVCTVLNSNQMECPSPPVNSKFSAMRRRKRHSPQKYRDTQLRLRIGFIMDNVEAVKDLEKHFHTMRSELVYVDDPKFFQFPNQIKLYKGDTLVIEVCNKICYVTKISGIVNIDNLDNLPSCKIM